MYYRNISWLMKRRLSSMKTVAKWWGNFLVYRLHYYSHKDPLLTCRSPKCPATGSEISAAPGSTISWSWQMRWAVEGTVEGFDGFCIGWGAATKKNSWDKHSRKPMKTIHKKQLMNGDMNKNHSRSRKAAQMSWCDPQCIPAVWWRGQSSPGKGQGLAIDLTIGPYLDGLYATLRSSPFHPFGTKWIYMNLPKNPNRPQYRGSTNHQPTIQISCWMRLISSWISARLMLGCWSGNFTISGNSAWMR